MNRDCHQQKANTAFICSISCLRSHQAKHHIPKNPDTIMRLGNGQLTRLRQPLRATLRPHVGLPLSPPPFPPSPPSCAPCPSFHSCVTQVRTCFDLVHPTSFRALSLPSSSARTSLSQQSFTKPLFNHANLSAPLHHLHYSPTRCLSLSSTVFRLRSLKKAPALRLSEVSQPPSPIVDDRREKHYFSSNRKLT